MAKVEIEGVMKMRNKAFSKSPLRLLLITGLLLSGGYTLTAKAAGVVTNCSTFGSTSTHPITHKFKKPNKISYISHMSYY